MPQNRVPVITNETVSMSVPLTLRILAVPDPPKEFRVEANATPEVPIMKADSFPFESKTKFFILNV
jgi:hypothetical protein